MAFEGTQTYVNRLLSGLEPSAFGSEAEGLRFVCAAEGVHAPAGWANFWQELKSDLVLEEQAWLQEADLLNISVLVVIADVVDDAQRMAVEKLGMYLCENAHSAPPTLLLAMSHRRSAADGDSLRSKVREHTLTLLKDSFVDDVLFEPSSGFALALTVKSKLQSLAARMHQFEDEMSRRSTRMMNRDDMASAVHSTRWEYLRTRVFQSIPPMRSGIVDHGRCIGGFQLGAAIMRSPFGIVYSANLRASQHAAEADHEASSMLVVEKSNVRHIGSMKMISCSLQAMEALRNVRHPSLPRLIDAFQTPRRLVVRMELLGDCTLFSRLKHRDVPQANAQRKPFSTSQLKSLVMQITAAVCHLHQAVSISHRDLKPENVVIRELPALEDDADGEPRIGVKIGGFELATPERRSQLPCGTMPFAAPEVILAGKEWYTCMSADIWSLGVLLMELACGLKSVNPYVPEEGKAAAAAGNLLGEKCLEPPSHRVAHRIQDIFGEKEFLPKFFKKVVPEAAPLVEQLLPMVARMVEVAPEKRIAAAELQEMVSRSF